MRRRSALMTMAIAILPVQAMGASGLGQALALCIDETHDLDSRAAAFVNAGWERDISKATSDTALVHALILSRIDPGNTASWAREQETSNQIASRFRERRGYDRAQVLSTDGRRETVTLEPNGSGLETCLYTGPGDDLSPFEELLAPSQVLIAGPRRSIRGDFPGGTVVAHAIDPSTASSFPEPLSYTATFTVVLDRRGRE